MTIIRWFIYYTCSENCEVSLHLNIYISYCGALHSTIHMCPFNLDRSGNYKTAHFPKEYLPAAAV